MQPVFQLNYLAILAAVAAQFVLGFLWYGPLFGKAWAAELKISMDQKPPASVMMKAMVLQVLGSFLTAYVLAHSVEVWRPSSWNAGADASNATYGFFSGFFTWLGFYVPVLFSSVAWEMRSWKLFWINASYYFLSLQIVCMILAHWR